MNTESPYATLDVPRTADKATIRRAYRRKAKAAHPDAGGSAETFHAIVRAHDILSDDARRERFDRTGQADDGAADNTAAEAIVVLNMAMDMVLADLEEQDREPHQVNDLPKRIRARLETMRTTVTQNMLPIRAALAKNEALRGRFTSEAENRMEALILARIATLRGRLEAPERHLVAMTEAIRIVDQHSFRADEEPVREPRHQAPIGIIMRVMQFEWR